MHGNINFLSICSAIAPASFVAGKPRHILEGGVPSLQVVWCGMKEGVLTHLTHSQNMWFNPPPPCDQFGSHKRKKFNSTFCRSSASSKLRQTTLNRNFPSGVTSFHCWKAAGDSVFVIRHCFWLRQHLVSRLKLALPTAVAHCGWH